MNKHFRVKRLIVGLTFRHNRFVGLGIEIDKGAGGVGLVLWMPLIDLTVEVWDRKALERSAEQLVELAGLTRPKVDWEQYAPTGRR